jgi:hypothetical protein
MECLHSFVGRDVEVVVVVLIQHYTSTTRMGVEIGGADFKLRCHRFNVAN